MINYRIINKENLDNEISIVIKFHLEYIKGNLTILGEQFIESVYRYILIHQNGTLFLLNNEKDKVQGFLLVKPHQKFSFTNYIFNNFKSTILTILKSLISLKKIKSLLCLFKELNIKIKNLDTKEVELIAMAVDSSLHGKGVGSNLIYFASENLKKKGLISIFVRIFKNDLKIINFYSKNSFSLIQSTNYFKVFRKKI